MAFPGSFIASSKNGQPIFLTSEQGKYYNINFNLQIGPWTQHIGRGLVRSLCLKIFVWSVGFSYWEVSNTNIISFHRWMGNKAKCVLQSRWDGSGIRLSSKAVMVQATWHHAWETGCCATVCKTWHALWVVTSLFHSHWLNSYQVLYTCSIKSLHLDSRGFTITFTAIANCVDALAADCCMELDTPGKDLGFNSLNEQF